MGKSYVFKVGTTTLVHKTGRLNLRAMEDLVMVLSDLKNAGNQVVLVSSGAIGAGVGRLGLSERPKDVAGKQACATVGQCELMFMYDKLFAQYGHTVGQLLITREDVEDPVRGKNLRAAFDRLFPRKSADSMEETLCVIKAVMGKALSEKKEDGRGDHGA